MVHSLVTTMHMHKNWSAQTTGCQSLGEGRLYEVMLWLAAHYVTQHYYHLRGLNWHIHRQRQTDKRCYSYNFSSPPLRSEWLSHSHQHFYPLSYGRRSRHLRKRGTTFPTVPSLPSPPFLGRCTQVGIAEKRGLVPHGRRFLQVKWPNQQYRSTEGDATNEKENNENN